MTEDKIKKLLQDADRIAPAPACFTSALTVSIRKRQRYTRIIKISASSAAALILIGAGLWALMIPLIGNNTPDRQKIAQLQTEVDQLRAKTDAMLKFVREVIESERRQTHLQELKAQLAAIGDPLVEIQENIDKTAFTLVYEANRMYTELNLKDFAVDAYQRVIELYPENKWADLARKRLTEIQKPKTKKGDLSCQITNPLLS